MVLTTNRPSVKSKTDDSDYIYRVQDSTLYAFT